MEGAPRRAGTSVGDDGRPEGAALEFGDAEPAPQGVDRAGLLVAAARDADGPALALLVGRAAADEDVDALVDEAEILDIEGGKLAAPEATGDAEQEDRPVADGEEIPALKRVRPSGD
jgi:hypothetical protein